MCCALFLYAECSFRECFRKSLLNVFVEFQSPGVYQATKRLVHTMQQDNVQHLLVGEMLLKASASRFAYAVVGGNLVGCRDRGGSRIVPFAHASVHPLNLVDS